MTTTKRSILLGLLSIMLALSCAFLALTINVNRASATVNDSIYNNYIENGNFETEYTAWGCNGATPERVDDGTGNHVGKLTGAAWVQARVWNAGFMYDNVYKISFKLKLVSADSDATLSTAQYLARLKGNDGAFLAENYTGIGCESSTVALNEWKTYTYYLKVADNRDGTYSVLAGMDYKNLAQIGETATVELSYLDIAIGCGNFGNLSEWYIDDYTMTNYTEYTKNLVQNGGFEEEYPAGSDNFWSYYGAPERVQLEDGNWVGKKTVAGGFWIAPRIWNASFMYDKTYRVSFNIKLVASDGSATLSGGQFLATLSSNDDSHIQQGTTYIDIGLNGGSTIGDWKTVSYFFRIEKGETIDVLYIGSVANSLTTKVDCKSTGLSHFNPLVGCGEPGNVSEMYLDDFTVAEYDGDLTVNSDMTDYFVNNGTMTNWGCNSWATTSTERYWDAAKQSYVIKNVGAGWICNRFWNMQNTFEFGKTYRVSAEVKGDTTLPNATLVFEGINADGVSASGDDGVSTHQLNGYVSQNVGVYNSLLSYIRIENENGTYVLYCGQSKANMAKTNFATTIDYLTHLDIKIGAGAEDAWYVDNFEVVCVSPDTYTSTITVTDANGNAINDFTYEITGTKSGESVSDNVLTITEIDGDVQVKISATGYLDTTVNVTGSAKDQTVQLESAYYNATITVTDTLDAAIEGVTYEITGTKTRDSISDNVIAITGALGEVTVVISKTDYVPATVTLTRDNATQTIKLASAITKYTATVTVTNDSSDAINGYSFEVTGRVDGDKTLNGNVLTITDAVGEISVKITADRYVEKTVTVTESEKDKTVVLENAPYTATLTVKESDGTAVTDFAYEVTGIYTDKSVDGNVITITGAVKELSVSISKAYYTDATVTVTDLDATKDVTFDKRAIVEDPTDYANSLYSFDGFEGQPLTETPSNSAIYGVYGLSTFINGTGATLAVTERDSHWGKHSVLVHSVGDRFTARMNYGTTNCITSYNDTEYKVIFWLKAVEGEILVTPCVYIDYYLTGDLISSGAVNAAGIINLGTAVTVTADAWTKIEVNFTVSVEDGKLVVRYGEDGEQIYESEVAGKEIIACGNFDLGFSAQGDLYLDDMMFFKTYKARVQVLDANGDAVTENVTLTATDYTGNTLTVTPVVIDGAFVFEGLVGNVKFTAEYNGKTYEATASITYPEIILADEYTATVKVVNGAGDAIDNSLIEEIFAQDGASRIEGVYDEENGTYSFGGVMGELKVYVYAKGYEQFEAHTVSRKNPVVDLVVLTVPSASDGMRGNTLLNGDVENVSQIEMYNNRQYALEGIGITGASDKWASYAPVLTLSDEAAVGEKSLRISITTEELAKDDAEYAQFMEDNDLDHSTFGDRVSYRAGNGYLIDGSTYRFTTYLKAPATQDGDTQVTLIYLMGMNLCNEGSFNYWVEKSVNISSEYWSKLEMYFSFNATIDDAATAGNYTYERYKLEMTTKMVLNGKVLCDYSGVYGYDTYKDGTYGFYSFNEKGELYGWGPFDTEKHDGFDGEGNDISNQEGGRSFGGFALCEPSFQITNNKSLLIDGASMIKEYTANITVNNQDLTPNDEVAYFRFIDKFSGEISYVQANRYYDEIDQKYYIPGLYSAYEVAVCDEDKNLIQGMESQEMSSENAAGGIILEYNYDIKLTVKDQNGNLVTDVTVRILLANGSYANATNNGDGTYTYEGLSGVRNVNFRKVSGSENSYTFPSGISVSSANNEFTVTVTLVVEDEPTPTPDPETEGKGCGGFVGAGSIFAAVTLLAGSAIALKKKH